jgi:hypothetical protein
LANEGAENLWPMNEQKFLANEGAENLWPIMEQKSQHWVSIEQTDNSIFLLC